MSKARTEYEQQEYRRIHPEFFTTMSQSVNPDGSLVKYEDVTTNIQKQLDKLEELHGGERYWWAMANRDELAVYNYLSDLLVKCQKGFVENYHRMNEYLKYKGEQSNV